MRLSTKVFALLFGVLFVLSIVMLCATGSSTAPNGNYQAARFIYVAASISCFLCLSAISRGKIEAMREVRLQSPGTRSVVLLPSSSEKNIPLPEIKRG